MKKFTLFTLGTILAITPWLLVGLHYYNSPFAPFFDNFTVYMESPKLTFSYLHLFPLLGLLTLSLAESFMIIKRREFTPENTLLLLSTLIPFALFYLLPSREPRYMLTYYPVLAIMATSAFSRIQKILSSSYLLKTITVVLGIIFIAQGLMQIWEDRFSSAALIDASADLKELTLPNEKIMSESYPYIYYFSERRAVKFPDDQRKMPETLTKNQIRYIIWYRYEPAIPPYIHDYLEKSSDFRRIRTYGQDKDESAAVIYEKINPPSTSSLPP